MRTAAGGWEGRRSNAMSDHPHRSAARVKRHRKNSTESGCKVPLGICELCGPWRREVEGRLLHRDRVIPVI